VREGRERGREGSGRKGERESAKNKIILPSPEWEKGERGARKVPKRGRERSERGVRKGERELMKSKISLLSPE